MDLSLDDTIAALASAPGPARRGIVRITGPAIRQVLAGWFEPRNETAWQRASTASVHPGLLHSVSTRAPIAVDVYDWPNRRSYTGQPLVELHLPGSPPLLEAVLSELHRRGARPARAGEFTLRAFLAGKLDLLQAEAVLGVIDAHDHEELQSALAQLAGGLSGRLSGLRRDLLELLADLEAGLDFIEEDIEFISRMELLGRIATARRFVEDLLQQTSDRMQSRTRPRVVLAGLPNAGKSTLFNRLTASQSALVSPGAGTTRDFLQATVDWLGLAFDLVDTAGWELHAELIAGAAQHHRSEQVRSADVVIWCSAAHLPADQHSLDEQLFIETKQQARGCVRILTQTDRPDARMWLCDAVTSPFDIDATIVDLPEVSAVTGDGLDKLAESLRQRLASARGTSRQWLGMTAARCRESLEAVAHALEHAEESAGIESVGDELIAVDVRDALDHLGRILGVIYTDDILDRVFSKFCIGK
ncbi:MAG: 50S ribosome-binding GTPase [Planctomycetes bacterium]|nr:50S ribosome-binding GTPase [Planctomycetota bacterium]